MRGDHQGFRFRTCTFHGITHPLHDIWHGAAGADITSKTNIVFDQINLAIFTDYLRELNGLDATQQSEMIMNSVRYARTRTTWIMLEMGLTGLASSAEKVWSRTRRLLVPFPKSEVKQGVAPESAIERRSRRLSAATKYGLGHIEAKRSEFSGLCVRWRCLCA